MHRIFEVVKQLIINQSTDQFILFIFLLQDTYTLPPLDFLDNHWIKPTLRSN